MIYPFALGTNWILVRGFTAFKHWGYDFAIPIKTPLLAVEDGTITRNTVDEYGGKFIDLKVSIFTTYRYLHNSKQPLAVGTKVKKGDVIALSGNSGHVIPAPTPTEPNNGAHVHFEKWVAGIRVSMIFDGYFKSLYKNMATLKHFIKTKSKGFSLWKTPKTDVHLRTIPPKSYLISPIQVDGEVLVKGEPCWFYCDQLFNEKLKRWEKLAVPGYMYVNDISNHAQQFSTIYKK